MSLNILQKIQIFLVLGVVKILEILDYFTGAFIVRVSKSTVKFAIFTLSFAFLFFIAYSFKTDYIRNVALGVVAVENQADNSSNTLGLSDQKKDLPILISKIDLPEITSSAVLVVDRRNHKTLFEKNSKKRLASASTTKLMTALIALDVFALDDQITISEDCANIDSTKADLPVGQSFRVESLLNAMLVASAGDAACALASGKVTQDEFVYRMNQKAYQMGLYSSYFTNPIGLDGLNSSHFSTAQDLFKLADAAVKINILKNIVAKKEYTVKSINEEYIGKLESTNKLLTEIPQSVGVKTGTTAEAGQVLIYEYSDENKDLMLIVMGSTDRFSDVRVLLNWVSASYSWK